MSIRAARKAMGLCLAVTLFFSVLGLLFKDAGIFVVVCLILAAVSMIGFYITAIAFWRCPGRGHHLPVRGGWTHMQFCPYCGADIEK